MIFENVLSLLNIHNHCRFRAILVTTAVVPEYRVLVPSRYFLVNLIFENDILSKVLFPPLNSTVPYPHFQRPITLSKN